MLLSSSTSSKRRYKLQPEHKFNLNTRSTSSRMKTLLLSLLCLFVWNQSTEALTDQQVVLGQSVTLACEFKYFTYNYKLSRKQEQPQGSLLKNFNLPTATRGKDTPRNN
ncbi:hypothetical protein G5714_021536 [Onychostoma macrolepis]|uniref:Uncharacterized protein n=1 Tax=Onychostoma macrolepis TaxID=369639 RepID=A0A7J6BRE4_9TELE|nr:hypothetical protein G5714_021536 [Onychostoma macrolepis]